MQWYYNKKKRKVSIMGQARSYTDEFKAQALKLAKEIGATRAARELGIPANTLGNWVYKAKKGEVDSGIGEQTPETALTLAAEVQELRKQVKAQEKEIKRLNELNEFLEDASAFFAASRRKSGRGYD